MLRLSIVLVLSACVQPKVVTEARTGAWYAIDLHTHSSVGSNDTEGLSPVADLAAVARERGLSMVVITDHSNSAGSMDCPSGDVEDCPNQGPEFPAEEAALAEGDLGFSLVVGLEISPVYDLGTSSEPTGHIGCIPHTENAFRGLEAPVIDRPVGEVEGGEGIAWCQSHDGFAIVNHPFTVAGWINYDWTSMDYDAIEVFNGGARFDSGDWDAVQAWACDVSEGRSVVPVGGSDTHRANTPTPPEGPLDQAIGFPTTWVWSQSDAPDALLAALTAGRVMVTDPRTRLEVEAQMGTELVGPGGVISASTGMITLKVSVEVDSPALVLEVVDLFTGACISDERVSSATSPHVEPLHLYSEVLDVGEPVEISLQISAEDVERLVVWVRPSTTAGLGHDGVALAAPIRIGAD
jgi:hypothetical protein